MLTIFCNNTYKTEREYICRVLLDEFLGLKYEIKYQERKDWLITTEARDTGLLRSMPLDRERALTWLP